ncbi:MAG: rhodanese-like domain-containing protein [Rubrivivax sp.]
MELQTLREMRQSGRPVSIVDVRSAEEFAAGHVDGAVNIPADQLQARAAELPADTPIVTVCSFGGARSCGAAQRLRDLGHADTLPLRGGTKAWQEQDRATEQRTPQSRSKPFLAR